MKRPVVRSLLKITCLAGLMVVMASCSGGGNGVSNGGIDSESPADGGLMTSDGVQQFTLHDAEGLPNPAYTITVYDDADKTTVTDSVTGLAEDGNGYAVWIPDNPLEVDREYWWDWHVEYDGGSTGRTTYESDIKTFFVQKQNAMSALSPRPGGNMDMNNSSQPSVAIYNLYTGPGAQVTYDFEMYDDPASPTPISSAQDVPQNTADFYTTWAPMVTPEQTPASDGAQGGNSSYTSTAQELSGVGGDSAGAAPAEPVPLVLDVNKTYYWRGRGVVNGVPQQWTQLNSFTVSNLCDLSGPRYAEHITEWTKARQCDAIIDTDTSQALGPPDACCYEDRYHPGRGFISIDIAGILGVEMGATVYNGHGSDIRVYEWWAVEPIELFAGLSEAGPWYSLGVGWCLEYCDWDLGSAGLAYARYFRIRDAWPPPQDCYETAGSDIDAVVALNVTTNSSQCAY